MIYLGAKVRDDQGRLYEVIRVLGIGAQGVAVEATTPTGQRCVVKVLLEDAVDAKAIQRLNGIFALDLPRRSSAVVGPLALLDPRDGVGSVMGLAAGIALDEHASSLAAEPLGVRLAVAAAVVEANAAFEAIGGAHGDLAPANIVVDRRPDGFYDVWLIDMDNFVHPSIPAPQCGGHQMYKAPELERGEALPSMLTDRFTLAIHIHEILLGRHPFATVVPAGAPYAKYVEAVSRQEWPDDPDLGAVATVGTTAAQVLSRPLRELFRSAFRGAPAQRPTARTWTDALIDAIHRIVVCDGCGGACIDDAARLSCPFCCTKPKPPVLDLGGRSIACTQLVTSVGRSEVGGSEHVSREHAVFRREGLSLVVEARSSNGLMCFDGQAWSVVAKGERRRLGVGDRVWFAPGVEAKVG